MDIMLLGCDDPIFQLLEKGEFIPVLAITLGCCVGIVAIIGGTITSVVRTRAREQTKRELAAYVAEGSIDPDQAVALANAGRPRWEIRDGDTTVKNA